MLSAAVRRAGKRRKGSGWRATRRPCRQKNPRSGFSRQSKPAIAVFSAPGGKLCYAPLSLSGFNGAGLWERLERGKLHTWKGGVCRMGFGKIKIAPFVLEQWGREAQRSVRCSVEGAGRKR